MYEVREASERTLRVIVLVGGDNLAFLFIEGLLLLVVVVQRSDVIVPRCSLDEGRWWHLSHGFFHRHLGSGVDDVRVLDRQERALL